MAYCPKCGFEINGDDRYCRSCGAVLAQGAPAQPEAPVSQASPIYTQAQMPAYMPAKKTGKGLKIALIIAGAVILALIAALILLLANGIIVSTHTTVPSQPPVISQPEPQPDPAPAPEPSPAPTPSITSGGTVLTDTFFYTDDFAMDVPENWLGVVRVAKSDDSWAFYSIANEQAGFGGWMFTICEFDKNEDYTNLPSYELIGYDGDDVYVVEYPTDVQWDLSSDELSKEYNDLCDGIYYAFEHFTFKED